MDTENKVTSARQKAITRHDIDSGIFQGRYENISLGKYTDPFIYGRYQMFEEIEQVLNKLAPGSKILDLGCGTGYFSHYLKNKGFEVIGLDPSVKMLDFARKNFSDIQFIEGISTSLPFENNSIDFIFSIEVLRYLHEEDVDSTYKEIFRVLKPNGKLLVTHVNLFCTDGYWFFYHIQSLLKRIRGQFQHYCYFTTSKKELKKAERTGFTQFSSVGRMFGSIRIGYKFGRLTGEYWAKFLEFFNKKQAFKQQPFVSLAGHLILVATK